MIKNLFIINFKALISGIFQLRRKKNNVKKVVLIIVLAFALLSFMVSFGSLFYVLLDPTFDAEIGWFYFSLQAVMSFVLSVFGTIFSAQTLFLAKDNELLMSMPIKPYQILISRLLVVLVFEYIFETLIVVPAFIVWVAGGRSTPAGILFCLTGYALLPLMALSVACLVSWVLSSIFLRFKKSSVLSLILSVAIFLLYLRLYWQFQNYLNILLSRGVEIAEAFRRALPPFYAFGASIVYKSPLNALVFALWAITPFALTVALMSVNYKKILTTNRGMAKKVYKEKSAKVSGVCYALTKRELAHYLSKPMIVLNTSISSLFMLIGAVLLIVKKDEFIKFCEGLPSMLGNTPLPVIAAAILTFMSSMNNLSASLISLEGRHFWIAKSIPVHPKHIFLSKIFTHMISSAVPCFLVSVPVSVLIAKSLTDALLIFILPQTFILLISVAGLSINMIFPRFDWTSEVQQVKQGLSPMIAIFGSMGVIILLYALYIFIFSNFIDIMAYEWILAAAFAAGALIIWTWLSSAGGKKFMEL